MPSITAKPLPEVELLICCARAHMDDASAERLAALLDNPLDWELVIRLAEAHKIVPVVSHHLGGAVHAVPAVDRLRERARGIAQTNLARTAELLRVVARLEANGITATPMKGPALAASAYGSLALRAFDDLDLLIDAKDVTRAQALLAEDGYRARVAVAPEQEAMLLRVAREVLLFDAGRDILIELQWRLVE
ncbi:MAG TPA: nucleotidyltransferase family protein, partial [Chthonomonadaceae bacterium]|nr:nucleotidyltransferase family protein [Chthonomonadaceae bacterium]